MLHVREPKLSKKDVEKIRKEFHNKFKQDKNIDSFSDDEIIILLHDVVEEVDSRDLFRVPGFIRSMSRRIMEDR